MTDKELFEIAREASKRAYVPYSHFPVGAALECTDGTIFTGCNVENAAYGSTICAERTAIVKAVSEGHTKFTRITVHADGKGYAMPCGSCRQVMSEFSPGMLVMCSRADGDYVSYPLSELMPHTFDF